MSIKVHTRSGSGSAYRLRIGLNFLKVDYEQIAHPDLSDPGFRKINPQGLVPALEIDGVILTQTLPILEYLLEKHPGSTLLPKDGPGRARVRSIAQFIISEIQPLQNTRLDSFLKEQGSDILKWKQHWVKVGLKLLEASLQDGKTGKYAHGDTVTLADVFIVPQVRNAIKRFNVSLNDFPTLAKIYNRLIELDEVKKAEPDNNPGF